MLNYVWKRPIKCLAISFSFMYGHNFFFFVLALFQLSQKTICFAKLSFDRMHCAYINRARMNYRKLCRPYLIQSCLICWANPLKWSPQLAESRRTDWESTEHRIGLGPKRRKVFVIKFILISIYICMPFSFICCD